METEFERQDELQDVLSDELPVEGAVPATDPEETVGQLGEASHALEWLVDLQRTVSQEGASRHDIVAMQEICTKLQGLGMQVKLTGGLEAYGPNHFTPNRSMLNQSVGLEGIGATILTTIKGWIQKLIDYILNAYKWYRNLQVQDDVISKKLENAIKKVERVIEETDRVVRFSKFDGSLHDDELTKYAVELREGKHVVRNRLTAAAFGFGVHLDPIVDLQKDCKLYVLAFEAYLVTLQRYLAGDDAYVDVSTFLTDELKSKVIEAQSWKEVQPDAKFLDKIVNFDRFRQPINKKTRTAVHWADLLKVYTEAGKTLKEVRRINATLEDPQEAQQVAEVIRVLSEAFDNIGKLITVFSDFNRTQLAVIDCYWKFNSRRYTLFMKSVMDNPLDGAINDMAKKAEASLKEFLRGEGV